MSFTFCGLPFASCNGPHYAMAHSNLGVLLAGRGDMAGAETAYRAAIAADPPMSKVKTFLQRALQDMKKKR